MVLLLSFIICFLGLLIVMGLSLSNIEIFLDAKFNSENSAQFSDFGKSGIREKDIKNWTYTEYSYNPNGENSVKIPFLPKDEPETSNQWLDNFSNEFKDERIEKKEEDKEDPKYKGYYFNNFKSIDITVANNFPAEFESEESNICKAANLHEGRSAVSGDGNMLMSGDKFSSWHNMYEAIATIVGVNLKDLEDVFVEDNYTNRVFFPAMKILEKGVEPPGGETPHNAIVIQ